MQSPKYSNLKIYEGSRISRIYAKRTEKFDVCNIKIWIKSNTELSNVTERHVNQVRSVDSANSVTIHDCQQ